MDFFGKYGNANIFYTSDWDKINEYEVEPAAGEDDVRFSKLGTSEWDSDSGTCKIYSSVLIKVVYSGMGFMDNQQQYIIDIQKQAIAEEWRYP